MKSIDLCLPCLAYFNRRKSIDRKSDISSVRWNMIFAEWIFKTYFHILNTATFLARVRYDRALLSLKNIVKFQENMKELVFIYLRFNRFFLNVKDILARWNEIET